MSDVCKVCGGQGAHCGDLSSFPSPGDGGISRALQDFVVAVAKYDLGGEPGAVTLPDGVFSLLVEELRPLMRSDGPRADLRNTVTLYGPRGPWIIHRGLPAKRGA